MPQDNDNPQPGDTLKMYAIRNEKGEWLKLDGTNSLTWYNHFSQDMLTFDEDEIKDFLGHCMKGCNALIGCGAEDKTAKIAVFELRRVI